jgi:alanine-synthesizing transaminase
MTARIGAVIADEIYDKILYDDAVHHCAATLAPDLLCLTLNGLSKAYRVAGFRSGWLLVSGPRQHAKHYLEGLATLAATRLCPNVPGQHAIQAALGGRQSITDLILPGGRLREQRDRAWQRLNEIPGVSCVKPQGGLYAFPRPDHFRIVTLPRADDLDAAITRIGRFLTGYRQ